MGGAQNKSAHALLRRGLKNTCLKSGWANHIELQAAPNCNEHAGKLGNAQVGKGRVKASLTVRPPEELSCTCPIKSLKNSWRRGNRHGTDRLKPENLISWEEALRDYREVKCIKLPLKLGSALSPKFFDTYRHRRPE